MSIALDFTVDVWAQRCLNPYKADTKSRNLCNLYFLSIGANDKLSIWNHSPPYFLYEKPSIKMHIFQFNFSKQKDKKVLEISLKYFSFKFNTSSLIGSLCYRVISWLQWSAQQVIESVMPCMFRYNTSCVQSHSCFIGTLPAHIM